MSRFHPDVLTVLSPGLARQDVYGPRVLSVKLSKGMWSMAHEDLTSSQVSSAVVEAFFDPPETPRSAKVESAQTILIASTFTADPIQRPLRFWMARLHIPSDVQMTPYAQVIQSLLDPGSA